MLDEKRFHKVIDDVLKDIRKIGGDGLFTAYHNEPAWAVARQYISHFVAFFIPYLVPFRPDSNACFWAALNQEYVRRHGGCCFSTCSQVGAVRYYIIP